MLQLLTALCLYIFFTVLHLLPFIISSFLKFVRICYFFKFTSISRSLELKQDIWAMPFGHRHWKPWQLSFQLLFYQSVSLIQPNTILGIIIFISRTHIKPEFILSLNPTSISVIRHHFHQQNIYLIRTHCMHPAPSLAIL